MEAKNIKTVVVVGGGTMGQGIVQSFAEAGLLVKLVDINQERLDSSLAQIQANLKLFQEFNLLAEDHMKVQGRIKLVLTNDLDKAVKECDFVLETIPEVLDMKRQLFTQLDSCRETIILATNTSSFPISAISEGCRTAHRIIGIHYFNPAHIMPLVEIHYSPKTSDEVIAQTKAFMTRIGKKAVIVKKDIPGLLGTRIQLAMGREIESLIAQGVASAEDIDTVGKASYGFRFACIGTMEAFDMVGLETMVAVERQIFPLLSNSLEPSTVLTDKVQKGELGVKAGRGWFDYTGKTKQEILDSQGRRLLKQLALYRSFEKGG